MPKDNFSAQSKAYASFRPVFPDELYQFIIRQVTEFDFAWDVATGNGQSAVKLAPHFKSVIATDISENQLAHAERLSNIVYKTEAAENASLADGSVDLITISQAIHWFEFDAFYKEVCRVAKPDAIIAAFSYSMFQASDKVLNDLIQEFYTASAPYWDVERRYIDEQYKTIPFPFDELAVPAFNITYQWSFEQVTGYFETWSANQHHIKLSGRSLMNDSFKKKLLEHWPSEGLLKLELPVHMRIGRIR